MPCYPPLAWRWYHRCQTWLFASYARWAAKATRFLKYTCSTTGESRRTHCDGPGSDSWAMHSTHAQR